MKEKERIFDEKSKKLKLKKMTKMKILQEKGITLIALVVTIIILLILAGVTLNMALSDNGLFNKTKEAAEKYKQAQSDEEEMVRQIATQMYSEYVGTKVLGYTPSEENTTCNISAKTTGCEAQNIEKKSITWKVWDFDGTILRIIGDSTSSLYLEGASGYNNGVWALDHICKELYSNEEKGAKATTLKRSDIQKVSTYDYTKYKHSNVGYDTTESTGDAQNTIQFGEIKHYDSTKDCYPDIWKEYDKNWKYEYSDEKGGSGEDKECTIWETIGTDDGENDKTGEGGEEGIDFKESIYSHNYTKEEFINEKYFNLIFPTIGGGYWLGTRSAFLGTGTSFGLCTVRTQSSGYYVGQFGLYNSREEAEDVRQNFSIRPIVSIDIKSGGYTLSWEKDEDGNDCIRLK